MNKEQRLYQICACKYTKDPPYCDASHTSLPGEVLKRHENCSNKSEHKSDCKLCTGCGWIPDF